MQGIEFGGVATMLRHLENVGRRQAGFHEERRGLRGGWKLGSDIMAIAEEAVVDVDEAGLRDLDELLVMIEVGVRGGWGGDGEGVLESLWLRILLKCVYGVTMKVRWAIVPSDR